eukprot:208845_1
MYRIGKIFQIGMKKTKRNASTGQFMPVRVMDTNYIIIIMVYVIIDITVVLVMDYHWPITRKYYSANIVNGFTENYGRCHLEQKYIYMTLLAIPKLIMSIFCMVMAISVYTAVSLMQFNEGLQTLTCVVISTSFSFIFIMVLQVINIESVSSQNAHYTVFSSGILLVCNLCIAIMIVPRIYAVLNQKQSAPHEQWHDNRKAMKRIRKFYSRFRRDLTADTKVSINQKKMKKISKTSKPKKLKSGSNKKRIKSIEDLPKSIESPIDINKSRSSKSKSKSTTKISLPTIPEIALFIEASSLDSDVCDDDNSTDITNSSKKKRHKHINL